MWFILISMYRKREIMEKQNDLTRALYSNASPEYVMPLKLDIEELKKIISRKKDIIESLKVKLSQLRDQESFIIKGLQSRIKQIQAEFEPIKEFARKVIKEVCWDLIELDGGSYQELAEKIGLIQEHTVTENEVDEESDFEVGDIIYKFTDILQDKEGK